MVNIKLAGMLASFIFCLKIVGWIVGVLVLLWGINFLYQLFYQGGDDGAGLNERAGDLPRRMNYPIKEKPVGFWRKTSIRMKEVWRLIKTLFT